MMLATWLVEFYLSKCNELDDLVASESVSQDVDNLLDNFDRSKVCPDCNLIHPTGQCTA